MKKIARELKWDALLTGILYIILGIMSLALPETMERILGYMIGVVLIIAGAVSMISYLLRDAHQNYYHNDFLHGLIGIAAGILILVKMEVVIGLISFLLGVMVLVSGCSKLQDVIDMKRLNCGNWVVMLVLAAVNVAFGVLLICNPFSWTILLFRLLGAGLIFSGVIDCIATVYFAGRIREYLDSILAVDSTCVEVTTAGTEASGKKECEDAKSRKKGRQDTMSQERKGEDAKPRERGREDTESREKGRQDIKSQEKKQQDSGQAKADGENTVQREL